VTMQLTIDTDHRVLTCNSDGDIREVPLYSREAFELISSAWLKVAWERKYSYTFTWQGRPIIQLPEDVLRVQEVVYALKPDVIVETGIAHGGSLIFYASLCKLAGKGRVIGVDVQIKPANRLAIENHELSSLITLIEGDSAAPDVVARVENLVRPGETVLVILDSLHTRAHVLRELDAYSSIVTVGSYIVATDGVMRDLADVPRGKAEWADDNPTAAAADFVQRNPAFRLEPPSWRFNESDLTSPLTHWPGAWVRRIRS
jgi:cephalosporin hydroxylase